MLMEITDAMEEYAEHKIHQLKTDEKNFRVIKRFLFIPKSINGTTKWLQLVNIKQHYSQNYYDSQWIDIEFI
jgi:hypothetical protein